MCVGVNVFAHHFCLKTEICAKTLIPTHIQLISFSSGQIWGCGAKRHCYHRSDAYSAEQVLLNTRQIYGGAPKLHWYRSRHTVNSSQKWKKATVNSSLVTSSPCDKFTGTPPFCGTLCLQTSRTSKNSSLIRRSSFLDNVTVKDWCN